MALDFFGRDPRVWNKLNNSPVSEADMAVDGYLANQLVGARPHYGWLSEETTDTTARLARPRLFIVDPIDGTRAFLAGGDDWTISVAVVEGNRPIAAALYRPVVDEMYVASTGGGATLNGAAMAVSARSELAGAQIVAPRSMSACRALAEAGLVQAEPVRSLALRIALVAAGRRDAALAGPRAHDWDLAAADLLMEEAGGGLTDLKGSKLLYNRPEISHPALMAAAPDLGRLLAAILRDAKR